MKRLVVFILLVSSLSVNSQVRIGLRGGINLANFVDRPQYSGDKKYTGNYLTRFNAGLMMEIPLNDKDNWNIYTAPFYSGKGNRVRITRPTNVFDTSRTYLNYIELPVSIAYKFSSTNTGRFIPEGGFYIAYGFNGKRIDPHNLSDTRLHLHRSDGWYKRIDIGFSAGVMYEIKERCGLRFDYSRSLFDISKPKYEWKEYNNVFGFSFFWYLNNKRKETEE